MTTIHTANLGGRDTIEHYIHEYAHQEQVRMMTAWLEKHRPGTFSFTGLVDPDDATVITPQATVHYGYCWFSLSDGPAVVRTPSSGSMTAPATRRSSRPTGRPRSP